MLFLDVEDDSLLKNPHQCDQFQNPIQIGKRMWIDSLKLSLRERERKKFYQHTEMMVEDNFEVVFSNKLWRVF